jgi:hypothetical protein
MDLKVSIYGGPSAKRNLLDLLLWRFAQDPFFRWRTISECPGSHHHLYWLFLNHESIFVTNRFWLFLNHESIFVTNRFGDRRHGFFFNGPGRRGLVKPLFVGNHVPCRSSRLAWSRPSLSRPMNDLLQGRRGLVKTLFVGEIMPLVRSKGWLGVGRVIVAVADERSAPGNGRHPWRLGRICGPRLYLVSDEEAHHGLLEQ